MEEERGVENREGVVKEVSEEPVKCANYPRRR